MPDDVHVLSDGYTGDNKVAVRVHNQRVVFTPLEACQFADMVRKQAMTAIDKNIADAEKAAREAEEAAAQHKRTAEKLRQSVMVMARREGTS